MRDGNLARAGDQVGTVPRSERFKDIVHGGFFGPDFDLVALGSRTAFQDMGARQVWHLLRDGDVLAAIDITRRQTCVANVGDRVIVAAVDEGVSGNKIEVAGILGGDSEPHPAWVGIDVRHAITHLDRRAL